LPHHPLEIWRLEIFAKFQYGPTPPIPSVSLSSPALHQHLYLKKSIVDHQFRKALQGLQQDMEMSGYIFSGSKGKGQGNGWDAKETRLQGGKM
jgi:hypothetical protein